METSINKRKRDMKRSLSISPLLQANVQSHGLPQETLPGLHGVVLLQLKLEQSEDRADSKQKFHLSQVTTNAGTRASAEGDEGGLLALGETLGVPALRNELVGIRTPDLRETVDSVAGNGNDVTGVEDVTGDVDGATMRGDLAGETHGGGTVDTHGFPDDPLEAVKMLSVNSFQDTGGGGSGWHILGNLLDHGVSSDLDILGDSSIQSLLQLRDNTRGTQTPVEDSTEGVGSSVRSSDELSQSLSGELLTTQLVTSVVLSFHQTSEQIDTGVVSHDLRLDTLIDTRDGNTSQILNSLKTLLEKTVGNPLGIRDQSGHGTKGSRDFTTTVQDLNSLDVGRRVIGVLAHLSNIPTLLEHTKRSSESQVTNDIKSQVVEPVQSVDRSETRLGVALEVTDAVPLLDEYLSIDVDILLELADGLGAEGMRDRLALAGVFFTVPGVEQTTTDRDEGIVEVTMVLLATVYHIISMEKKKNEWCTYALRNPFP